MPCALGRRSRFLFFLGGGLLTPVATLAAGPSFPCNKASSPDERVICADRQLSSLDLTAAIAYEYSRTGLDGKRAESIRTNSLRKRRACKSNEACIRSVIAIAITDYKSLAEWQLARGR